MNYEGVTDWRLHDAGDHSTCPEWCRKPHRFQLDMWGVQWANVMVCARCYRPEGHGLHTANTGRSGI